MDTFSVLDALKNTKMGKLSYCRDFDIRDFEKLSLKSSSSTAETEVDATGSKGVNESKDENVDETSGKEIAAEVNDDSTLEKTGENKENDSASVSTPPRTTTTTTSRITEREKRQNRGKAATAMTMTTTKTINADTGSATAITTTE